MQVFDELASARERHGARLVLAEALLAELRARAAMAERARRAAEDRRADLEASLRVGQREQITRELGELTTALLALE